MFNKAVSGRSAGGSTGAVSIMVGGPFKGRGVGEPGEMRSYRGTHRRSVSGSQCLQQKGVCFLLLGGKRASRARFGRGTDLFHEIA